MNNGDFNFLSMLPPEKLVYRKPLATQTVTDTYARITVAHGVTTEFFPMVRYSRNGTDWYMDGDGPPGQDNYTSVRAEANNTHVRITFMTGRPQAVNIQYEVIGLAKNV